MLNDEKLKSLNETYDQIEEKLNNLSKKMDHYKVNMEQNKIKKNVNVTFTKDDTETTKRLKVLASKLNLTTVRFKKVPDNYYNLTLDGRKELLNATSIHHLCKSMIIKNHKYNKSIKNDYYNSEYYCVILQYTTKMSSNKINKLILNCNNSKLTKKDVLFTLAGEKESDELSGFKHNAVTPLGMKVSIPILLSKSITTLKPLYIWLGGGEVNQKFIISVNELINHFNPIIDDIVN